MNSLFRLFKIFLTVLCTIGIILITDYFMSLEDNSIDRIIIVLGSILSIISFWFFYSLFEKEFDG